MVTYNLPITILLHFAILSIVILGVGIGGFIDVKSRVLTFIGYGFTLISIIIIFVIVFFPFPINLMEIESNIENNYGQSNNFIPFNSIIGYIKEAVNGYTSVIFYQLIGNIILFMPYGFALHIFFFKDKRKFPKTIIFCIITSLSVEVMQGVFSFFLGYTYRSIDFDDFLLNAIGGFLGYFSTKLLYLFFFPKSKEKKHLNNI